MRHMLNLRAVVQVAEDSADSWLMFQAIDKDGKPIGQVATANIDDTGIIRSIIQAYRMGTRYGKETD